MPNRNLDIYAADLDRIEVLEGPQGTLFGSGAEAGVIRYITNEPKVDVTEGSAFAQAGAMHTGHAFTQAGSNPTFAGAGNISTSRLRFEDPASRSRQSVRTRAKSFTTEYLRQATLRQGPPHP
jgi:outer membrane receptor protein involved in Fe transport